MKRIICTICSLLVICISGCTTIGGGHGGPTNSANLTAEKIWLIASEGRDSLSALGFTVIFNGGGIPSDTKSTSGEWAEYCQYEAQTGTLVDEGVKRDWPEMGFFGKYGLELIKDAGLFVNVLGGATFADEVHLYHSTLGPPHYTDHEGWNIYGMFGGGISYFLNGDILIQIDHDNRRGLTVGLCFWY